MLTTHNDCLKEVHLISNKITGDTNIFIKSYIASKVSHMWEIAGKDSLTGKDVYYSFIQSRYFIIDPGFFFTEGELERVNYIEYKFGIIFTSESWNKFKEDWNAYSENPAAYDGTIVDKMIDLYLNDEEK